MSETDLHAFVALARQRRAVRHFKSDPIDPAMLAEMLDAARWAPSGYNLQPTHFVVVRKPKRREALRRACLDQPQITEAPVIVVIAGDRRVVDHHFDRVLEADREAGAISPEYEQLMRRVVPLGFGTGPLGLGWLAKLIAAPLLRLMMAVPSLPAIERKAWLARQASLCAMNFMMAAAAAGLDSCPMEGFDERRVRRVLAMPRWMVPLIIVPVGISSDVPAGKTRLPASDLVHYERWR